MISQSPDIDVGLPECPLADVTDTAATAPDDDDDLLLLLLLLMFLFVVTAVDNQTVLFGHGHTRLPD